MSDLNISGKNFEAKCRCTWYYKFFCNCDYKNKQVLYVKKKKNVEKFCIEKPDRELILPSARPTIQTLDKTENDLYMKRTLGPGAYSYDQPRVPLCEAPTIGYNVDRSGLLPLNDQEVDIESKLRYSESVALESYSRPVCNNIRETRFTREIKPLNDISAEQFDRFELPPCDPQAHISTREHQFGKDTRNYHDDKFFSGYRRGF